MAARRVSMSLQNHLGVEKVNLQQLLRLDSFRGTKPNQHLSAEEVVLKAGNHVRNMRALLGTCPQSPEGVNFIAEQNKWLDRVEMFIRLVSEADTLTPKYEAQLAYFREFVESGMRARNAETVQQYLRQMMVLLRRHEAILSFVPQGRTLLQQTEKYFLDVGKRLSAILDQVQAQVSDSNAHMDRVEENLERGVQSVALAQWDSSRMCVKGLVESAGHMAVPAARACVVQYLALQHKLEEKLGADVMAQYAQLSVEEWWTLYASDNYPDTYAAPEVHAHPHAHPHVLTGPPRQPTAAAAAEST